MRFSTRPKYTLRKLTIGLVSVFFGTVVIAVSRHAHAAVVDSDQDKPGLVIKTSTDKPLSVETTTTTEETSTPSTTEVTEFDGTKEEAPPVVEESVAEESVSEVDNDENAEKDTETSNNSVVEPNSTVNTGNAIEKASSELATVEKTEPSKEESVEEKTTEKVESDADKTGKVRTKRAAASEANQVVDQINWDAILYETYDKDVKITGWDLEKGGYDVLLPNTWDFQQKGIIGEDGVATISSGDMHKIVLDITDVSKLPDPDQKSSITISHNGGSKLIASNENWSRTFSVQNEYQRFNPYYNPNLIAIDANHLDTYKITNMEGIFYKLYSLHSLNIEDWNVSNVKSLSHAFGNTSLTNLDLNSWDTQSLINLDSAFIGIRTLASLKIDKWNTSKITNIERFLVNTSNLKEINLAAWDTSKIITASYAFKDSGLEELDVSNWDTSNLKYANYMFSGTSFSFLGVSRWDTSNLINATAMFSDMRSLTKLDVSKWDTSNLTTIANMFENATSLENLDVSRWDTHNIKDMQYAFDNTQKLQKLDVSKWNTSNVINLSNTFANSRSLKDLDVSKWNTSNVTNMNATFSGLKFSRLDISNWDTSKVNSMVRTFARTDLEHLDISKWNTSNVINMYGMFEYSNKISFLDISKWDTSNVKKFESMFSGMTNLDNLDVSKWDTSSGTNFRYMFSSAKKLSKLDIDNWDMSKAIEIYGMFLNTINLESINVSKWDVSNVKNMHFVFSGSGIKNLDLSTWNTQNVELAWQFFRDTKTLETINLSNLNFNNLVYNSEKPWGETFEGSSVKVIYADNYQGPLIPGYDRNAPLVIITNNTTPITNEEEWNRTNKLTFKIDNQINGTTSTKTDKFSSIIFKSVDDLHSQINDKINNLKAQLEDGGKNEVTITLTSSPADLADEVNGIYKVVVRAATASQEVRFVNQNNPSEIISSSSYQGKIGESKDFSLSVPERWKLADGQTIPTSITFTKDAAPIIIGLVHDTVLIDQPVNAGDLIPNKGNVIYEKTITNDDLTYNVTRTITIHNEPNSSTRVRRSLDNTRTIEETVSFKKTYTLDLVTMELTDNGFELAPGSAQGFTAFTPTNYAGYNYTVSPNSDALNAVDRVAPTTSSFNVDIFYEILEDTQVIEFVDKDTNEIVGPTYSVTGQVSKTIATPKMPVPDGWKLVDGQIIPTEVLIIQKAKPIRILIEHDIKEISENRDDLTKLVTRTINIVDPHTNQTSSQKQTAEFKRSAFIDQVTGEVVRYSDWDKAESTLAAVITPIIPGYTASTSVGVLIVTPESEDSEVTVTYTASDGKQTIIFIEKASETELSRSTVNGKTNETIKTDLQVPSGYKLVDGQTIPTEITIGPKDEPIKIYVEKVATPVTPTPEIPTPDPTITPEEPTESEVVTTEDIKITDTDNSKTEEETTTSKEHLEVKDLDHKSSNGKTTKAKLTIVSTSANPDSSTASQATLPQTGEKSRLLSLLLGLSLSVLGLTALFKKRDNG
ncbi:lipoprotein [Lactobacillus pasteurii DSM 23907 = CRBIP 24.76]|uniref:Lipoprotein n=1 Tax=Lactobacillus pasteurii DSM 23907 = CRBIP 24.76 TaxID=1423790 RepID=I7LAT8_9LACO|nr:BspA family leucine-rich repeat surface protein [Lactobacillus pasteurii]KRK08292.1 lipoprotein [Lactobacillus pasteurii DSM 23907 = CRBIP 24.76]TDG77413.1 hypothetical protein C5L33_000856 [Lactobacillus pasteurii]CCI84961.1 Lipoprotein [Lactobacillus pasteurii DSM 23907 = CRBIP 24.76]